MSDLPDRTLHARLLFQDDDRVLLARPRGEQRHFLPGGPVLAGETVAAALRREIEDDLGLSVSDTTFVGCAEHTVHGPAGTRYELNVVFATPLPRHAVIASRDDAIDIVSVAARAVPGLVFRPVSLGSLLQRWLETGRPAWRSLPAAG